MTREELKIKFTQRWNNVWMRFINFKSHGKCPRCGAELGPPGTAHTCS